MTSFWPQINFIVIDGCSILINNNGCRPVIPKLIDFMDDGHGDLSPIVLMGFRGSQPVYRVTNTLALYREGKKINDFQVHWPALFPNVIVPICGSLQLDVTFRINNSFQSCSIVDDDQYDDGYDDNDDESSCYNSEYEDFDGEDDDDKEMK